MNTETKRPRLAHRPKTRRPAKPDPKTESPVIERLEVAQRIARIPVGGPGPRYEFLL